MPTLSGSDVTNVPVGNATGTRFSGVYVADSSVIAGCSCRSGSCSKVHGDRGETFTLTEMDGALSVLEHGTFNDTVYGGGIDKEGRFRVGGSFVSGKLMGYSLLSGTVLAGASIDAESQNTLVGPIDGDDYDCDVAAALRLSYLKPR